MNFAEYQEAAWRTVNEAADIEILGAMGLAGEAGEYVEHVKKVRFHDHDENHDAAAKELGDVLWYLAVAAKQRGLTLEQVAVMNIEKLKKRYPVKFDAAKSQKREDPDYDVSPEDTANGWTGFDKEDKAKGLHDANTNSAGDPMLDRVMGAGIFGDSGT